ncbi:MAG: hypothetical protein ABEI31_08410 [Halodesulfurarchaeum sp.]
METYEATFEIDSRTDAVAVERLAETLYNAVREESRSLRSGSGDSTEMLAAFEAIREATGKRTPGRLTVIYEQEDGQFAD